MMDSHYLTERALSWLKKYMNRDADLNLHVLTDFFSDPFTLRMNGLVYDKMSLDVHLTNLNVYRSGIIDLNYKVIDSYYDIDRSVSLLSLRVVREDQDPIFSDVMLRLGFDEKGLIDLWHRLLYPIQNM